MVRAPVFTEGWLEPKAGVQAHQPVGTCAILPTAGREVLAGAGRG